MEFLLGPALELAEDVTPAVRLRAAGLLPALKRAVRLPDDVAALEGLNSALAKLQVGYMVYRVRVECICWTTWPRWRASTARLPSCRSGGVLGLGFKVGCSDDVAALEGSNSSQAAGWCTFLEPR